MQRNRLPARAMPEAPEVGHVPRAVAVGQVKAASGTLTRNLQDVGVVGFSGDGLLYHRFEAGAVKKVAWAGPVHAGGLTELCEQVLKNCG